MKKISVVALVIAQVLLTLLIFSGAVMLFTITGVRAHSDSYDRRTVPVVVAATDLRAQTRLTAKQVEIVEVPARDLRPNYLTNSAKVTGGRLKADVMKGQPLTTDMITREMTAGELVRPGMRAFSLSFSTDNTGVGLVEPGSLVDVHVTLPMDDEQIGEALVIAPLLQQLRVLAVDDETILTQGKTEATTQRASCDSDNVEVLLEVTDKQAGVLQLAQRGRLALVLRNPMDRTFHPVQPMILKQGRLEPFGDPLFPQIGDVTLDLKRAIVFLDSWTLANCDLDRSFICGEYRGRKNVLWLRPLTRGAGGYVFTKTVDKAGTLEFAVVYYPKSDGWKVGAKADGKELGGTTVNEETAKDGWAEISLPLPDNEGKPLKVEITIELAAEGQNPPALSITVPMLASR